MWSILVDKNIIHIHYNDLHEIYNFRTPFLGVITTRTYLVSLINEKKIFKKEIMHFHYMNYIAMP